MLLLSVHGPLFLLLRYSLYGSPLDAFQNTVPSNNLLAVRKSVAYSTSPCSLYFDPTTILPDGCPIVMPFSSALLPERQPFTTLPSVSAATARQSATVIGTALWG